jgi:Domain of unknown function (DUF397)
MNETNWRKSTYSRSNGNCVEVGTGQALVAVRDSMDPDGPVIDVSPRAWIEFTEHVKRATPGHRGHRPSTSQRPA